MFRLMEAAESLSTTDWLLLTDVLLLGPVESGGKARQIRERSCASEDQTPNLKRRAGIKSPDKEQVWLKFFSLSLWLPLLLCFGTIRSLVTGQLLSASIIASCSDGNCNSDFFKVAFRVCFDL